MKHAESDVKVYISRDYGLFRMVEGNRQLNSRKIEKIKGDIAGGLNILRNSPIIVNERDGRLDIIDGQHRFYVCKQLKSPVWYILAAELSLLDIAKVNSHTEHWKNKDFINCYAVQGNKDYEILDRFIETYKFPVSVAFKLLKDGTLKSDGGSSKEEFQGGNFKIGNYASAIQIADTINKFSSFKGYKTRPFIVAICKILEVGKTDINEVIESVIANPGKLTIQPTWKDYLVTLEIVVNFGKSKRRILY